MTSQQMIELVIEQSRISKGSIAQIYLEKALIEFCEQTGMIRKKAILELSTKAKFHTITQPDDILVIRDIFKDGIQFDNTRLTSYLSTGNPFWHVEATDGSAITIATGFWNGTAEGEFEAGTQLDIIYEAKVPFVRNDGDGNPDYTLSPEIPERWRDAVVARASEKANLTDPALRRYFYAVWNDELRKAKQFAKSQNTDAIYNVKVYTL